MKYWLLLVIPVVAILYFVLFTTKTPVCPEDFDDEHEKTASFETWTNDFYSRHPDATVDDFGNARLEFYRENHCEQALKRVQDYNSGNVDPETRATIENAVEAAY